MKKIASIAAIAVFAIAFTSCKKDYTCECTTTGSGATTTSSIEIKDAKKKDAEKACEGTGSVTGGGMSITTTCKLK